MAEKSIGGFIRDISKEVQDTRMEQARAGDEFEAGSLESDVVHQQRLIRLICEDLSPEPESLRNKMKKLSAIAQRLMLRIDLEPEPMTYDDIKKAAGWITYRKGWGAFDQEGLAQPGTMVEKESTGERFMIGDINKKAGRCDDCAEFRYEEIISRYKVFMTPEELENV